MYWLVWARILLHGRWNTQTAQPAVTVRQLLVRWARQLKPKPRAFDSGQWLLCGGWGQVLNMAELLQVLSGRVSINPVSFGCW